MRTELTSSNLVIVARLFNPSILSQLWLVRNGVVEEQEFREGCIFTDQVVNVQSNRFTLVVVPPQLQFTPNVPREDQGEVVVAKVGAVVRALPHTPYTAIGLNFTWRVEPEETDLPSLARSLFFDPNRRICQLFDSKDARFGAYFSRDTLGCRLKLDVKPIAFEREGQEREALLFSFNFHLGLPRDGDHAVEAIEKHLRIWDAASDEAEKIVAQAIRDRGDP